MAFAAGGADLVVTYLHDADGAAATRREVEAAGRRAIGTTAACNGFPADRTVTGPPRLGAGVPVPIANPDPQQAEVTPMSTVEQSIVVELPVRAVYNQWTQFEDYPEFMKHVQRVTQLDETHLHWEAKILGVTREWVAEITEQEPDRRIAWRAQEGNQHDGANGGVVTFHRVDDEHTTVMLQLEVEPDGLLERAAKAGGIVDDRVAKDLRSFKKFIEKRGSETSGWRGQVGGAETEHLRGSPLSATDRNVGNTGAFESWTKADLYERARDLDLAGRSKMTKLQLIGALRSR